MFLQYFINLIIILQKNKKKFIQYLVASKLEAFRAAILLGIDL